MSNNRTEEYRLYIEECLAHCYDNYRNEPQEPLFKAMEYSLLAGGKRLRPIFALDFCRMCGGDPKDAVPFAMAMEMIHTYSLIHDDLPSMDNDDFRRGRPTNHKVFGEAMAILAGDALLTDAFRVAASAQLKDPSRMGEAIRILADCSGSNGMVGGQVLDIMSEERQISEQEIIDIQSRKTGALIRAACMLGVVAGNSDAQKMEAARTFADALGLAFQIRDDMLDVIGTQEEMGQGVGTDAVKNTFVRLYGLEKCEEYVQTYTQKAIDALSVFEESAYMKEVAMSLTTRRT